MFTFKDTKIVKHALISSHLNNALFTSLNPKTGCPKLSRKAFLLKLFDIPPLVTSLNGFSSDLNSITSY